MGHAGHNLPPALVGIELRKRLRQILTVPLFKYHRTCSMQLLINRAWLNYGWKYLSLVQTPNEQYLVIISLLLDSFNLVGTETSCKVRGIWFKFEYTSNVLRHRWWSNILTWNEINEISCHLSKIVSLKTASSIKGTIFGGL